MIIAAFKERKEKGGESATAEMESIWRTRKKS